jgi:hypothetical protein
MAAGARRRLRVHDGRLCVPLAARLFTPSVLPLTATAIVDIGDARARLVAGAGERLGARGDTPGRELEAFLRVHRPRLAELRGGRSVESAPGPASALALHLEGA